MMSVRGTLTFQEQRKSKGDHEVDLPQRHTNYVIDDEKVGDGLAVELERVPPPGLHIRSESI